MAASIAAATIVHRTLASYDSGQHITRACEARRRHERSKMGARGLDLNEEIAAPRHATSGWLPSHEAINRDYTHMAEACLQEVGRV